MTTIINVTTAFAKAALSWLEKLCAIQIGRPWYTSVEDYSTPESVANRDAYSKKLDGKHCWTSELVAPDELIAMERKLGTGRPTPVWLQPTVLTQTSHGDVKLLKEGGRRPSSFSYKLHMSKVS